MAEEQGLARRVPKSCSQLLATRPLCASDPDSKCAARLGTSNLLATLRMPPPPCRGRAAAARARSPRGRAPSVPTHARAGAPTARGVSARRCFARLADRCRSLGTPASCVQQPSRHGWVRRRCPSRVACRAACVSALAPPSANPSWGCSERRRAAPSLSTDTRLLLTDDGARRDAPAARWQAPAEDPEPAAQGGAPPEKLAIEGADGARRPAPAPNLRLLVDHYVLRAR